MFLKNEKGKFEMKVSRGGFEGSVGKMLQYNGKFKKRIAKLHRQLNDKDICYVYTRTWGK